MHATIDAVGSGLLLAFVLLIPLIVAATAASIVVGGLGSRIGARDPMLAAIARAAAVIVSLFVIGGAITGELIDFCRQLWIVALPGAGGG
ncbi:MAG TPA: hypothetical protein ENJ18_07610 [Nannocystis exedens]|nr:hypothetical protein [Nannocystis exedens]